MDLSTVVVAVVIGGLAAASYVKGKPLFAVSAGLGALVTLGGEPVLGLLLAVPATVGAFRLATPGSIWDTNFYGRTERRAAELRFSEGSEPSDQAPRVESPRKVEPGPGPESIPEPRSATAGDAVARERIAAFLASALARGAVDNQTYSKLRALLDEAHPVTRPWLEEPAWKPAPAAKAPTPVAPHPPPPVQAPPQVEPPVSPKTPPDTAPPPTKTPVPQPAAPPPQPVAPAVPKAAWEPGEVLRRRATELWEAVGPDVSVHGFTYLGLLLTFVGVFGFMFFSFADLPDAVQPFIEVVIPVLFFVWAWFLKRRDAVVVGDIMELLGGLVLPLVVFAGLVDSAPVPPDLTDGWLIAGLFTACLLIAAGYAWWTGRHPDSMLRYLVAPMIWVAALAPGFAFKSDERLIGPAITRLVSAQPALSAAAITATLAAIKLRPDHRLAAPSAAAALAAVPITYLLTVVLAAGEGWAYPVPLVLAGAATIGSAELLAQRYEFTRVVAFLRPFLLAVTLIPLVPVLGLGWTGLIATTAYLVLLEWEIRGDSEPVAMLIAGGGVLAGLAMTVEEPWLMVAGWALATMWAHWRRIQGIESEDARQVLTIAATVLPIGVAVGLVWALPDAMAALVIGAVLAAVTGVVRWSGTTDHFWKYWLTAAGAALAVGILSAYIDGSLESLWPAAAAGALAAVTLGVAPGWPAARVWMAAGAGVLAMRIGLDAGGVSAETEAVWWATAGLGAVVAAWLWGRAPAAHLAAVGHLLGFGALLAGGSAGARAFAVTAWTLGWLVTVVAGDMERDSVAGLMHRGATQFGAADPRVRSVFEVAPAVVLATSIPFAVLAFAGLWDEFGDNRAWTGLALALLAIGYGVGARLLTGRRSLSVVFAVGAVVLSIIGVAVTAPDPWPSIVAAASVMAVAWLVARPLAWTLYTWFAWVMFGGLTALLAYQAGVPARNLHFVVLLWGGFLVVGGLAFDDLRTGRRQRGEGLRLPWVRYPVVLGALAIPLGLAPIYTQGPEVFGWWSLLAAGFYAAVAVQLRAGAVTAPAYALAAVGVVALSPWPFMERPAVLVPVAAVLVLLSWGAERLQGRYGSFELYQRWDLPPLAVAHIVAFVGLVRGAEVESVATWIGFGILSVVIGVWKHRRAWADAGNVLVLVGAAFAGPGWLALALAATAVRGVIGAITTTDLERVSYHVMGVVAAGLSWVAVASWQEWTTPQVVSYTALVFGALALVVGGLTAWLRLAPEWTVAWGGLALAGIGVSAALAPWNVVDAYPAIGMLLFAAGSGLTTLRYRHWAMQALTVAAVGMAWLEVIWWQDWSTPQVVSYTALAFGAFGAAVGALTAWRRLAVDWLLAWGGLALVGVGASVALAPGNVVDAYPALGTSLFALGSGLTTTRYRQWGMQALTVAAVGVAWVEVVWWQQWQTPDVVGYTSIAAGTVALVAALLFHLGRLSESWSLAWGGLAVTGLVVVGALSPGTEIDVLPAAGTLLFASAVGLVSRSIAHPAIKVLTVFSVGWAWVQIVLWQDWSTAEVVASTALVFGAAAVVVGAWMVWRALAMDWAAAWGGLALAGIAASVALAPGNLVDVYPAIGTSLFAVGSGLAARRIEHPAMQALTVAAVGVAWAELIGGVGWSLEQAVSYTSLAVGAVGLLVGLLLRFDRLSPTWAVAWGALAMTGTFIAWGQALSIDSDSIAGPAPALGLAMLAAATILVPHPRPYPLHYASIGLTGWAWVALALGLDWTVETTAVSTAVAFGMLGVMVSEVARSRWGEAIRSDAEGTAAETARAWMVLGGVGVVAAAVLAATLDERIPGWLAVAAGLGLLAFALARGASPLSWPPMRELSALVALAAGTVLGLGMEAPYETMATGAILAGVAATMVALWMSTRRSSSLWIQPLLFLGVVATIEALAFAVATLPRRDVLALVLLGTAAQVVAFGLIRQKPVVVSLGPPIVLAAWIGVAGEASQGRALWFTVPIAVALIAEVDIARWSRRRAEEPLVTPELLALEYGAIGLLGAVVLVEMFASSVAYGLLAFAFSGGLLLWAAATRVRRRAIAAAVLATVTAVLVIFAAAASAAPPSAFFWIVAAGTGFAVMLAMALIEAYRSKTGSVMLRFDELMEGWE